MNFNVAFHTDVGLKKRTNQDSLCIKQAKTNKGNVFMALVCDGMGGLEKGELASAVLTRCFSNWFENELPVLLGSNEYFEEIRYRWGRLIKEQNQIIAEYGRKNNIQLGTTLTVVLFFEDGRYLVAHVGDTRFYKITDKEIKVLTLDQTVVANEVRQGRLTQQQAEEDPRRNILLQCIGASKIVEPDFIEGNSKAGECYMICSDGFRHTITPNEIHRSFSPMNNLSEKVMKENIFNLVELNKARGEIDYIS